MNFLILSPDYNDRSGGVIALHKLCHILNLLGHKAYLVPFGSEHSVSIPGIKNFVFDSLRTAVKGYRTNPSFATPYIKFPDRSLINSSIVIYPEIVGGNPLSAKRVVRWFLHEPGFHTGIVSYCTGELYFPYENFGFDFKIYKSRTSKNKLTVTHFFFDLYGNSDEVDSLQGNVRRGSAFCIRKGKGRALVPETKDSILIDDLSHVEISNLFKSVTTFYSYDLNTAYSILAAACGCRSIVIPDPHLSRKDWLADRKCFAGVSYGLDDVIDDAQNLAIKQLIEFDASSQKNVEIAVSEMMEYFNIKL